MYISLSLYLYMLNRCLLNIQIDVVNINIYGEYIHASCFTVHTYGTALNIIYFWCLLRDERSPQAGRPQKHRHRQ